MDTVRIELGEKDYAIVVKTMLHKTARQVQQYYRQFMKPRGKAVLLSDVQSGKATFINDYEIDITQVDDNIVAEIFMLNQVIEWSFGPVTSESISNMPSDKFMALEKELDALYAQAPFLKKTATG